MNDSSEHNDGGLTRSVRQFRRIARLAGVDPLRLLPPDPLIRLALLGAPMAALIDVAPFERLREALAAADPARSNASPARTQPLMPDATARRPHASGAPPDGAARSKARRDLDGFRAGRNTVVPFGNEGRWREEPVRNSVSPTLAQRRADLRRGVLQRADPSQSPSSISAQASMPTTTPAASRLSSSNAGALAAPGASVNSGASAAGGRVTDAIIAAAHSPRPLRTEGAWANRLVDRNALPSGRETNSVEASDGAGGSASVAVFTAPAGSPFGGSTRNSAQLPAIAEISSLTRRLDAPAGSPPDLGPRREPLELPGATAARPQQSWNRHAGLELTDDLFEVLYRNGVDLSWP
jgi:hypothetical protein